MYHVVCHDCRLEEVYEVGLAAEVLADLHGENFGHDVEYGRLE